MTDPPSYVVLSVRKTTQREWDGVLADGRRIYARANAGAWCVRVGKHGEDAIAGEEIAAGTYARSFGYRNLKARTRALILWPPGDIDEGLSEETRAAVVNGLSELASRCKTSPNP